MKISVAYTTQLKSAIGHGHEQVELPEGAGLQQLVNQLADRYPDAFGSLVLDDQRRLLPSMVICVNEFQWLPNARGPLCDGDSVTFVSAISGG